MNQQFQRIERLPPYVFNIIGELKQQARARGEDVDVAFDRRREEGLGRIGDGVRRRLETRADDPDQRQYRDQRIENHQDSSGPFLPRRRLGDGIAAHRCFTLFRAFT